jgi:hypothetical protein
MSPNRWKMQHIEVHLYENEEYDEHEYESYWASNRTTLVGEMEFEFQDMYFVHIEAQSELDLSIIATSEMHNSVYIFDEFEETACVHIKSVWDDNLLPVREDKHGENYTIWRKGESVYDIKHNIPPTEISEDQLSVKVHHGQIIQYVTIAPRRLESRKWKMQHVEVQLYENERYRYGNAYMERKTVMKEFTYDLKDSLFSYVDIEPRNIFDVSILALSDRNNNVYVFDDDNFKTQTKCMEIRMKDEIHDIGYIIWRMGQSASAIKLNVPEDEMYMSSVRVFNGQIIQYITIAPERLKILKADGKPLGECPICLDNIQDIILQPCQHRICKSCYDKMIFYRICPLCRESVGGFSTVYEYAVQGRPIIYSQDSQMHFESYNIFSLLTNLKSLS